MIDLRSLQTEVYNNKVRHGFNVTDVAKEILLTHGELAEVADAYLRNADNIGEELADVVIFILGIAEILHIDLETEIINKVAINALRVYDADGNKVDQCA